MICCKKQCVERQTVKGTSELVTPSESVTSVVSLAAFKQHIKWDPDDASEDDIMAIYIAAATEECGDYIGRAILPGQWKTVFDSFYPEITIDVIPIDPDSIVVKYYDADNAIQTLNANQYTVKTHGKDAYVTIDFDGNALPSVYDRYDAVHVAYTAGYGIEETDAVPARVKLAILIQAAGHFENRQSEQSGASSAIIFGAHQQLFPLKML
jgi:uncharacterized phiE125 gp8 family phage protein